MTPEDRILAMLAMLAEQTGEQVSAGRMKFYCERLLPLGAERVAATLEAMLDGARRFPTVNEIKAELGEAPQTVEDKGREVADRIWTCLTRGWASTLNVDTRARRDEYVGPIGLEVVRLQGGWQRLGEVCQDDEETTRKAQWRETARILAQKGGLGEAPQYERLAPFVEDCLKLGGSVLDITPRTGAFAERSQPKENE